MGPGVFFADIFYIFEKNTRIEQNMKLSDNVGLKIRKISGLIAGRPHRPDNSQGGKDMHYKKIIAGLLAVSLCFQGGVPVLAAESGQEQPGTEIIKEIPETEEEQDREEETPGTEEELPKVQKAAAAEPEEQTGPEKRPDTEETGKEEIEVEADKEAETAEEEIVVETDDVETSKESMNEGEEASVTILNEEDLKYTGYPVKPLLYVKYGKKSLKEGTDYSVSYENNTAAGTASGTVTGIGDYGFEKTFTFTIAKHELEEKDVQTSLGAYALRYKKHSYGSNSIFVAVGSKILKEGVDYELSDTSGFKNNVSGAKVTVTGIGNCTGSVTTGIPEYDPVTYDIQGSFTYGEPGTTDVTVKIGNKTLIQGEKAGDGDYYVTVKNTSDTMVEVSVNGEYDGAELYEYKTFRVSSRAIKDQEVNLSGTQFAYTGSPVKPDVSVTVNGTALKEGEDYVLQYKNNTVKGTATVTVTGTGHYTGTVTKTFVIADSASAPEADVTAGFASTAAITYSGAAKTPAVTVKADGKTLVKGTDYTVTYENNINAGKGIAHIKGKGSYSFSRDLTFTISPKSLTASDMAKKEMLGATEARYMMNVSSYNEAGIYDSTRKTDLVEGVDYDLENKEAYRKDKGNAVAKGKGNYTGTLTFTIPEYEPMSVINKSEFVYGDIGYEPDIEVIFNKGTSKETVLKRGEKEGDGDYYVRSVVSEGRMVLYEVIGHYKGFEIYVDDIVNSKPRGLTDSDVILSEDTVKYTGKEAVVAVTVRSVGADGKTAVLTEGTDYTISYENNTQPGNAVVTVRGKGNYTGTVAKTFVITDDAAASYAVMRVENTDSIVYDGLPKEPGVYIDIDGKVYKEGVDYKLTYKNNINAGTAYVTVSSVGAQKPEIEGELPFTIRQRQLSTGDISIGSGTYTYTGKTITPEVTVKSNGKTLKKDTDYTVTYTNNINVGTARIKVAGKGNYAGTAEKTFAIAEKLPAIYTITPSIGLSSTAFTYNGKRQVPTVIVKNGQQTLSASDYNVKMPASSVNAGTYTITVELKGKYRGTATATYRILPKKVTPSVTLSASSFVYNGGVRRPAVTVKIGKTVVPASGYTLSIPKSINTGTYTATVSLKGNYTGTAKAIYKITPKKVTPAVTLAAKNLTYNGKVRRPVVTVKIGKTVMPASTYTVTYAGGRKNVGTYTVTVKMKGNYTGTAVAKFIITPAPTTLTRFKGISGKLAFDVRWKKQAVQTTGYQLQYSTDRNYKKNVKTVTVKGPQNVRKTITGVKGGKYYYIRIRTYKTVSGKNYYSGWKNW